MSYKSRKDLSIYKSYEVESTFIEILNSKKGNVIVGCIYRHPSMSLAEFNDYYLNKLLDNLSRENKSIFSLGDFNVNLLNYDNDSQTNEFLDSLTLLCPNLLYLPQFVITAPICNNFCTNL